MSTDSSADRSRASTYVDQVLRRVDEQLSARERFGRRPVPPAPDVSLPDLPDASGLAPSVDELRASRAPLFATGYPELGQRLPRQLANVVLRAFVGRQEQFNESVAAISSKLTEQILALRHQVALVGKALEGSLDRQQDLADRAALVEADRAAGADAVGRIDQRTTELGDELHQLRTDQTGLHRWNQALADDLDRLAKEQRGTADWVKLIERKLFGLALDVRSSGHGRTGAPELAEPFVVDRERLAEKVAATGGRTLLEIGAGEKTSDQHINVDARQLPDVDVVADVRHLPFEAGTVDGIRCAHLVEHFREHELRTVILPYWRELLRDGGRLEIVCPNLAACIDLFNDGELTLDDLRLLVYGGQEYEGDDHLAGYTPEVLTTILRDAGFSTVEVVTAVRMDGICPEMELVATR